MSVPYLPKKLYRVTRSDGKHRYLAPQGKTFSQLKHAKAHADKIERDGATAHVFECEPQWREVERNGPDEQEFGLS